MAGAHSGEGAAHQRKWVPLLASSRGGGGPALPHLQHLAAAAAERDPACDERVTAEAPGPFSALAALHRASAADSACAATLGLLCTPSGELPVPQQLQQQQRSAAPAAGPEAHGRPSALSVLRELPAEAGVAATIRFLCEEGALGPSPRGAAAAVPLPISPAAPRPAPAAAAPSAAGAKVRPAARQPAPAAAPAARRAPRAAPAQSPAVALAAAATRDHFALRVLADFDGQHWEALHTLVAVVQGPASAGRSPAGGGAAAVRRRPLQPAGPRAPRAPPPQQPAPRAAAAAAAAARHVDAVSNGSPLPPVRTGRANAPHPPGYVPDFRRAHAAAVQKQAAPKAESSGEEGSDGHELFKQKLKRRRELERMRLKGQADRVEEMRLRMEQDREGRRQLLERQEEERRRRAEELEAKRREQKEEREKERELRRMRLKLPTRPSRLPLHKVLEQRYEEDFVLPALELQREQLRRRREAFERNPEHRKELLEHERLYTERLRQRAEQKERELREELQRNAQLLHKYDDTPAGHVPDPRALRREQMEKEQRERFERRQRQLDYGQLVKELHAPPVPPPVTTPVALELPSSSPQRIRPLDAQDKKRVGNDYMHQGARHARRRSDSSPAAAGPATPSEDSETQHARAVRQRGNDYMHEASKRIRRPSDGAAPPAAAAAVHAAAKPAAPKRAPASRSPPRPQHAHGTELRPLRDKVRRLDRVFNNPQNLLGANGADVDSQQDKAMEAVAAVRAKIELLQQLD